MATYPIAGQTYAVCGFPFGVPVWYSSSPHNGADLCGNVGDVIVAPTAGTVERAVTGIEAGSAADTNPNGNHLVVRDTAGRQVWFTHMTDVYVSVGDQLTEGQALGTVGWTGLLRPKDPSGSHVHFVMYDAAGRLLDPTPFLQGGDPAAVNGTPPGEDVPLAPFIRFGGPGLLVLGLGAVGLWLLLGRKNRA